MTDFNKIDSYGSILNHKSSKSNLPVPYTANFEALKGGLA